MARGFLTGLVHGGLLSAAVLAAAALLMPPPTLKAVDPAAVVVKEPEPVPATPSSRPDAVEMPLGSEFGRGVDEAPVLPEPGTAMERDSRAPAAVPAPEVEAAPIARAKDNIRPETALDARMPAQAQPAPGDVAPTLDTPAEPATLSRSQSPGVPALAAEVPQDDLPAVTWSEDGPPAVVPSLPSPSLDLSLPPDLTDLRRMERN